MARPRASIMADPTMSPVKETGARRRLSVDEACVSMVRRLQDAMERLGDLWDSVGMDMPQRDQRVNAAWAHFNTLMDDILECEEEMVRGVETDIKATLDMNNAIRKELNEKPFPQAQYRPKSIALLKALRKDLERLKALKDEVMAQQLSEYDSLTQICGRLDESVPNFEGVEDKILPKSTVKEIVSIRKDKQTLFEERLAQFVELQSKVNKMNQVVKEVILDEYERELLTIDLNISTIPLSNTILERFNNLLDKLNTQYQSWLEEMDFTYIELYAKLEELGKKCYAEEIVHKFEPNFDPDYHTDNTINDLRSEVDRLTERYEQGAEVYDQFAAWRTAYEAVEQLAELMKTDEYRKNRGGIMNRALKKQTALKSTMVKSLAQLKDLSEERPDVNINGVRAYDFVKELMEHKENEKENARQIKLQKMTRAEEIKMAQRFGTSYSPNKTSASRKRVQTPSTATKCALKKVRRSSSFSVIEPVINTPRMAGPSTSSPITFQSRTPGRTPARTPARTPGRPPVGRARLASK